jgi:anti-anti-sigma factor
MLNEPFSFEKFPGRDQSTLVFRLTGPLLLQSMFELQAELSKENPAVTIFDLANVPYMDSAGMGVITNYYVSASRQGHKVIIAAASSRVQEVFKLTKVDTVIPMVASLEAAETLA